MNASACTKSRSGVCTRCRTTCCRRATHSWRRIATRSPRVRINFLSLLPLTFILTISLGLGSDHRNALIQGSSGQSCVLCAAGHGWICRRVSGYVTRARTRILTTSRVSRHRGMPRPSSYSIVRQHHIDDLSFYCLATPPPLSLFSFLFSWIHCVSDSSWVLSPFCCVVLLLSSTHSMSPIHHLLSPTLMCSYHIHPLSSHHFIILTARDSFAA